MNIQRCRLLLLCALVMAAGCVQMPQAPAPPAPSAAAAAPAAAGPPTLPQFLGLTTVCKHLEVKVKCLLACLGKLFPYLEPHPPLMPLSSPANLKSPIPAVAAAAKIKAAQDAAPQKIKALNYLATIGCTSCYPGKNGPLVKQAFLSALQDCTESVRFAAVSALLETAGNPCSVCKHSACCGPDILRALHKIAYQTNPQTGCYIEPSARVRRVARLAIRACGGIVPPAGPGVPLEGPVPPPPVNAPPKSPPTPAPPLASPTSGQAGKDNAALARIPSDPARKGERNESAIHQQASMSISPHVTERQIQEYYEAHREQFSRATEVRWERITAAYDDFPSEETARAVVEYVKHLANGIPADPPSGIDLEQVTVRTYGWTARRHVSSRAVSDALFSLPVGRTSAVLTDSTGCHLVRVLEQRGGRAAPLSAVREEVVQRILDQRRFETGRVQVATQPSAPTDIENLASTPAPPQDSAELMKSPEGPDVMGPAGRAAEIVLGVFSTN